MAPPRYPPRAASRRRSVLPATALVLGVLATATDGRRAFAIHVDPDAVAGVAISVTGLKPLQVAGPSRACTVGGVVQNGSNQPVTLRLRYPAWGTDGAAFLATARVARVTPGERREFTSSPLARPDGGVTAPCGALKRVETLETVTDVAR